MNNEKTLVLSGSDGHDSHAWGFKPLEAVWLLEGSVWRVEEHLQPDTQADVLVMNGLHISRNANCICADSLCKLTKLGLSRVWFHGGLSSSAQWMKDRDVWFGKTCLPQSIERSIFRAYSLLGEWPCRSDLYLREFLSLVKSRDSKDDFASSVRQAIAIANAHADSWELTTLVRTELAMFLELAAFESALVTAENVAPRLCDLVKVVAAGLVAQDVQGWLDTPAQDRDSDGLRLVFTNWKRDLEATK